MKILIKILLLILFFYVTFSPQARGQDADTPSLDEPGPTAAAVPQDANAGEKGLETKEYDYENTAPQEDDIFSYEEDFLTRKLFQRDLPPLTQKEKIIWSFRMADTNAFL